MKLLFLLICLTFIDVLILRAWKHFKAEFFGTQEIGVLECVITTFILFSIALHLVPRYI